MVRLDLAGMNSREVNRQLKELIKTEPEIELDNPHSPVSYTHLRAHETT